MRMVVRIVPICAERETQMPPAVGRVSGQESTVGRVSGQKGAEAMPIVDCDVHPMYERFDDLVPYLSAGWRRHFEDRGARTYARARDRYNHPNKTYRVDALPQRGGAAGSDRDFT